jgi:hypothetical protein
MEKIPHYEILLIVLSISCLSFENVNGIVTFKRCKTHADCKDNYDCTIDVCAHKRCENIYVDEIDSNSFCNETNGIISKRIIGNATRYCTENGTNKSILDTDDPFFIFESPIIKEKKHHKKNKLDPNNGRRHDSCISVACERNTDEQNFISIITATPKGYPCGANILCGTAVCDGLGWCIESKPCLSEKSDIEIAIAVVAILVSVPTLAFVTTLCVVIFGKKKR